MIGIIGCGIVGTKVAELLSASTNEPIVIEDLDQTVVNRIISRLSGSSASVFSSKTSDVTKARVVVLAYSPPHTATASEFLANGVSVVSTSDDVVDCLNLLDLDHVAKKNQATLVVGASSSPGMSGLLVRNSAKEFDVIDEVHIALHGTGGPACARQHHRALASQSIGWHDGQWLRRPGGSGRELCWFPEPVGAYDCYRAELPDPLMLKRAFPQLDRVTARVSATRRDRFFAKMPMMIPPQAEGGLGGLRVEVRGTKNGARIMDVLGVVDRVGQITGVVAAVCAQAISLDEINQAGVVVLGESVLPNELLLAKIVAAGINIHSFVRA